MKKKKTYDQIHSGRIKNSLVNMTYLEFEAIAETTPFTTANEKIRLYNAGTVSRELFTFPWRDSACFGLLYKLLEYRDYPFLISEFEFACLILWGKRTIQNQFKIIQESDIGKHLKRVGNVGKNNRRAYKLLDTFKTREFEGAKQILITSHYKSKIGMNKPEDFIFYKILERLYPYQWEFTGDRKVENLLGTMYPDFSHKIKPFVIEFNGPFHHDIGRIKENTPEAHDENRRVRIKNEGKKALILRMKDLAPENMEKTDNKIKRLVEG